jgi:uncharacterized membrane protein YqjE
VRKPHWIIDRLNLDKTYEAVLEYIELRLELLEIQIKERTVIILSSVAILMIIVSLGLFVLLFLSFGLAVLLNGVYDSTYLGYLTIGGFYLLLCIVIVAFRDKLIISNFIKVFFEDSLREADKDEEHE